MEKQTWQKGILLKLVIVWLGIIFLGTFGLTIRELNEPVCITVMPESPRKNEPILATFKLNNPYPNTLVTSYQFYVDGKLLKKGKTIIPPLTSKTYQYAYTSPVKIGERVNFAVKTSSDKGNYEKVISVPPFPPQICCSFISFASFSTSVMSSMAGTTYYKDNFTVTEGLNSGLVISLCLILLLIFLELAGAATEEAKNNTTKMGRGIIILERFKIRFSTLTWLLFIIFMGIVYTKVVVVLSF